MLVVYWCAHLHSQAPRNIRCFIYWHKPQFGAWQRCKRWARNANGAGCGRSPTMHETKKAKKANKYRIRQDGNLYIRNCVEKTGSEIFINKIIFRCFRMAAKTIPIAMTCMMYELGILHAQHINTNGQERAHTRRQAHTHEPKYTHLYWYVFTQCTRRFRTHTTYPWPISHALLLIT